MLALATALVAAALAAPEVNGYLDARSTFTRPLTTGLLPSSDVPIFNELIEGNAQLKQAYAERGFVYGDVSLITQVNRGYLGLDATGHDAALDDHDVKSLHPLASINELYLSHDVRPELNVLVGKQRLVWGTGFAFNPTDVINPPKDPTDPNFQRAGAYMARVEVPLEKYAFTLVAAPAVLEQDSGIPFQFLTYPTWDAKDAQLHYQLAARAYALVANSDVNLMLFYGNRYNDAFENKLRAGASFSRYFFTDYEVHFEALVQSGSARDFVNHDCVQDGLSAFGCYQSGTPFTQKSLLDSPYLYPKILAGTRYEFSDESLFSLEYFFQSDGYTRGQFQDFVSALDLAQQAGSFGVNTSAFTSGLLGAGGNSGVPQKFVFQPVARHYLFASYSKPKIRDDFTAGATVIANLQDLSLLVTPSLAWSVREWVTVTATGFIPIAGPDSLAATTTSGRHVSEYGNLPMAWRALLDVRVFY